MNILLNLFKSVSIVLLSGFLGFMFVSAIAGCTTVNINRKIECDWVYEGDRQICVLRESQSTEILPEPQNPTPSQKMGETAPHGLKTGQ